MKIEVGLTGHFTIDVHNPETGEHRTYEFENLITNGGLDRLGAATTSSLVISHVQVGTGSTAPAVTDSALASYLAGTNRLYSYSASYGGSPTFHTEATHTWQFDQGAAAGNLSEIGVGWSASGSLFSRALIVDGSGNPTTITVAAIEFLTVTYKLRMYPPTTDVTGSISMGGTTYDYIIRPSSAGGSSWSNHGVGGYATGSSNTATAWSGDIGAITSSPAGSELTLSISISAYASGSYKLVATVTGGISQGNFVGGLRSVRFNFAKYGGDLQMAWQCQFNPALPKDNTKTLSLTFEVAWARKP